VATRSQDLARSTQKATQPSGPHFFFVATRCFFFVLQCAAKTSLARRRKLAT
jgi:hypothetical protein